MKFFPTVFLFALAFPPLSHAEPVMIETPKARPLALLAIGATSLCISSCEDISTLPEKPVETKQAAQKPPTAKPKRGAISEIAVGNVYQLVQSKAALIYDVRPSLFYKMGHIPNAISFPKDDFDRALSKHEPNIRAAGENNTPVIVYCTDAACPDALIVADKLASRGHDISLLRGGYDSWKKATR